MRSLEAILLALEGILGGSWGSLRELLAGLGVVLRGLGEILGGNWGSLGGILGPSWPQDSPKSQEELEK